MTAQDEARLAELARALTPRPWPRILRHGEVTSVAAIGDTPPFVEVDGRPMRFLSAVGVLKVGDDVMWVDDGADPLVLDRRTPTPYADHRMSTCMMARAATQSITTGSFQAVTLDATLADDFGMWDAGTPTRIALPVDGRYLVQWSALFNSFGGSPGQAGAGVSYNGSPAYVGALNHVGAGEQWAGSGALPFAVNAGYVELTVFQSSGGSINLISATLSVTLLSGI